MRYGIAAVLLASLAGCSGGGGSIPPEWMEGGAAAAPAGGEARQFPERGTGTRPVGGLSMRAEPEYVRLPGEAGARFDLAVRLQNAGGREPGAKPERMTVMEPLIQGKTPYWVRLEGLSPGTLPVVQPDAMIVLYDRSAETAVALEPGAESPEYRLPVVVGNSATPPRGRFRLRPVYEVSPDDPHYGDRVRAGRSKGLWQGRLEGSPIELDLRKPRELEDAREDVQGAAAGAGPAGFSIQHAPAYSAAKGSLSAYDAGMREKDFQLTAADDASLLVRGERLDENDRAWIERVERRGGDILVVVSLARWSGTYYWNTPCRPHFAIDLGRLPPGNYVAACVLERFEFTEFAPDGRPKDPVPHPEPPPPVQAGFSIAAAPEGKPPEAGKKIPAP